MPSDRRVRLSTAGVVVIVVSLLILLPVALLYAYRAQSPAVQEISYADALGRIQRGEVSGITVSGSKATLEIAHDGIQRLQVTMPQGAEGLARAVSEHDRADPGHLIAVRYVSEGPPVAFAISVLLSLMPILLLVALVLLLASVLGRGRAADRYEQLGRLADLRDRAALTEEEFQREKRRLLG